MRPPAHLDPLAKAIAEGYQVVLGYADREGKASERRVHPLGLVQKGALWYLVANTEAGMRTFRVSRVRSVQATDGKVEKPEGFDLDAAWREIAERIGELRSPLEVSALADQDVLDGLRWVFDGQVVVGDVLPDGRVSVKVRGQKAEVVTVQLAGWGDAVEVTGPAEVRSQLAEVGRQLVAMYAGTGARSSAGA
jgi:predicted DNA-binding transcriptional regulator YafY